MGRLRETRGKWSRLGDEAPDDGRIELVLRDLNARVKFFGSVAREDWDGALGDDLARVHPAIDIVDRAAGLTGAGGQGLLPGFQAGKRRKQRGMDIDDATRERVEQGGLDHPHPA